MNEVDESMRKYIRQWHGLTDEKMENINNLTNQILNHAWPIPADMLKELTDSRLELNALVTKCHTPLASTYDRAQRNALLKQTVSFCLHRIKGWAIGQRALGAISAEEMHLLGFLTPGETGGNRKRAEPTDARAEVKVNIISPDYIKVSLDQSAGQNAALVKRGWPEGVRHAVIVALFVDGKTEVFRYYTTRLHNDIRMPEGLHGKLFIIKAAFLKHINDDPRFGGASPTFSMPLSTEDLAAVQERRREADAQEHARETERRLQKMEALLKNLEAQTASRK
jgi:hypothetical protein